MLTHNSETGAFVLTSNNEEKAQKAGLTLSTVAKGPSGEKVWYTADYDKKPDFNPYAALNFYDEADAKAKAQLDKFKQDYDKSWADDYDGPIAKPDNGEEYMPFQKAGIKYGIDNESILIGDEPGLGKTIQSIGIANEKQYETNLIICPASIRLNWQREIRNWSTIPLVSTHPILKASDGIRPEANYNIISYDLLRNHDIHDQIYNMKWGMISADEIHYAKNLEADRTRALFGGGRGHFANKVLVERGDKFVGLSGTPLPNRARECYAIARALCWDSIDYESFDAFKFRYNPSYMGSEDHGRELELQNRLRCNFMIRRLKKDVAKDLPDKRYEFTYVEPNGKIKEVLAKEALIEFDIDDLKNPFSEIWGQISTVRREMGEAMVPRVVEHIKFLMDVEEIDKVVIFSHHKSVMDYLKEKLAKYGVVEIRGGMSPRAKDNSVQSFKNDPNVRIFSGQLDAAGFGVDGLQSVSHRVVLAEPAWTRGTNEQAIDRTHRFGQHENVIAQFMMVAGSFAERVLGKVLVKTQNTHSVLDER
jgi:SWI/SNF-related matrix-associated actin-dependent regulator 1 of chromatin subfamily A